MVVVCFESQSPKVCRSSAAAPGSSHGDPLGGPSGPAQLDFADAQFPLPEEASIGGHVLDHGQCRIDPEDALAALQVHSEEGLRLVA